MNAEWYITNTIQKHILAYVGVIGYNIFVLKYENAPAHVAEPEMRYFQYTDNELIKVVAIDFPCKSYRTFIMGHLKTTHRLPESSSWVNCGLTTCCPGRTKHNSIYPRLFHKHTHYNNELEEDTRSIKIMFF